MGSVELVNSLFKFYKCFIISYLFKFRKLYNLLILKTSPLPPPSRGELVSNRGSISYKREIF